MPERIPAAETSPLRMSPAGLAGEYLRSFAGAARRLDEFDAFFDSLRSMVSEDPYLAGMAELSDYFTTPAAIPNFEELDQDETIVSVSGAEGNAGFLKYRGRRDGEPFGAEDLHLMGAIAGFISVLTAQANRAREQGSSSRVLEYLLNQLPLGVVCFDQKGSLFVENKLAKRLLGDTGSSLIRGAMDEGPLAKNGKARLHIETEGKLIYAEGRRLHIDEDLSVTAFVLHDLSGQREKLSLQLERAVYRAEAKGSSLTLALFEDRSQAGHLYRTLKASEAIQQLSGGAVAPIDAYSCACVFPEKSLRSVRYALRNTLPASMFSDSVKGALLSQWQESTDGSLASDILQNAQDDLRHLPFLLRASLLVLDPYPSVAETLDLIASEVASVERVENVSLAKEAIQSGKHDGVFVDVDSCSEAELNELAETVEASGAGFRIDYMSHMQPSMVYAKYGLGVDVSVFQKPFDAEQLRESLALQFNFA